MSDRMHRWGPLSGLVFVVLIVIGFILAGSSPNPDASNAKIASYLGDSSKYHRNIVGFVLLLAAMLFLILFFASLRSRLVDAEAGLGRMGALGFGAGVASTVFLTIAILLFTAPIVAAHDAGSNTLDPGIYRFAQDAGYLVWVASAVAGALAVWATAAVVMQTGILPRWFGWLSIVVGVACLFAILFFPILAYGLWIGLTGILLTMRSEPAVTPTHTAPHATPVAEL